MNKTELINAIAEKSGLSKVDSKKALEAFIESVTEEVKKDGKVALVGFGTFSVTQKAARKGINPRTKAVINIPARPAAAGRHHLLPQVVAEHIAQVGRVNPVRLENPFVLRHHIADFQADVFGMCRVGKQLEFHVLFRVSRRRGPLNLEGHVCREHLPVDVHL